MAIEYKDEYPELARTLYTISTQEMEHMNLLHNEVTSIIKKWRDVNGEPPADMLAVYDYLHKETMGKDYIITIEDIYSDHSVLTIDDVREQNNGKNNGFFVRYNIQL